MNFFDRFAEAAAKFVSRAWFFVICVVLVVVWAPSLPVFRTVDTWQLVINTVTTIITFLLVALLQNSQWRENEATNRKLNATADGLADTMDALSELMTKFDVTEPCQRLQAEAEILRETVGLEKRISSSKQDEKAGAAPGAAQASRERQRAANS
jgi:Low affinity iron permease